MADVCLFHVRQKAIRQLREDGSISYSCFADNVKDTNHDLWRVGVKISADGIQIYTQPKDHRLSYPSRVFYFTLSYIGQFSGCDFKRSGEIHEFQFDDAHRVVGCKFEKAMQDDIMQKIKNKNPLHLEFSFSIERGVF